MQRNKYFLITNFAGELEYRNSRAKSNKEKISNY
jgi:hypothetical protein